MSERTSLHSALTRIAKRGLEINTVIDVGASDGRWSLEVEPFWRNARYHLIEAFEHWKPALEELVAKKPNYSYTLAAAGPMVGRTRFTSTDDPMGGSAAHDAVGKASWDVPMVSIDDE
jgi:FkbM family methyltransferase